MYTSSPNICVNCFIVFYILMIVCWLLIKFLIPNCIVIRLFNPLSRCCLESGLYFKGYEFFKIKNYHKKILKANLNEL
jgi:hypothetical protein